MQALHDFWMTNLGYVDHTGVITAIMVGYVCLFTIIAIISGVLRRRFVRQLTDQMRTLKQTVEAMKAAEGRTLLMDIKRPASFSDRALVEQSTPIAET